MIEKAWLIINESDTLAIAAAIAQVISAPCFMTFSGNLGAGKTTFIRGIFRELGFKGVVKSPTYTIVEPYVLDGLKLFHFDLYRIWDLEELELMGFRDYFIEDAIILLEWPEQGGRLLPTADISCYIEVMDLNRKITLKAHTKTGEFILTGMTWTN